MKTFGSKQPAPRRIRRHGLATRRAWAGLALVAIAAGVFGAGIGTAAAADDGPRGAILALDRDGDGYTDDVETLWGTNPDDPTDHPPELVQVAAMHDVLVVPARIAAEVAETSSFPDGIALHPVITDPVTGATITAKNPMSSLKGILGFDPTSGALTDPFTGESVEPSTILDPVTGRPIGASTQASSGPAPEFLPGRDPSGPDPYADGDTEGEEGDGSVEAEKKKACFLVIFCVDEWYSGGGTAPDAGNPPPKEPTDSERGCTLGFACTCPKGFFATPTGTCSRPGILGPVPKDMTDPDSTETRVPSVGTGSPPAPDCRADCPTGGGVEPGQRPEIPTVDPYANWVPDVLSAIEVLTGTGVPPSVGCELDGPGCTGPDVSGGLLTKVFDGWLSGTPM